METGGTGTYARPKHAPWPFYAEDEISAATAVLASGKVNYWTGDEAKRFEDEYAQQLGRRRAIAVANGTVALELALIGLGVAPGDEVITTPRTFIATAAVLVNRGAVPVFADVDPHSGNLTAETVEAALSERTRGVVAVHLGGWPCDMDPLMDLTRSRGLWLIEDCAQAHGAEDDGRQVGSFGDAAAFSFCQDKIISTGGEGGMLLFDDDEAWRRAWSYKDHGKSFDAVHSDDHPPGFRWLHESFGTNLRMTEFQAAIGRVQLQKLEGWVEARTRNSAVLREHLAPHPALRVPEPSPNQRHAYYRFYFYLQPDALRAGWSRDRVLEEITARGVRCSVGSCGEIYRERAFLDSGLAPLEPLPVARELARTSLALEVHPTLSEEALSHMGETVVDVLQDATR